MKRKKLPQLEFDSRKPCDARRFLRGLRLPNEASITEVIVGNGTKVILDQATDDQDYLVCFPTVYRAI